MVLGVSVLFVVVPVVMNGHTTYMKIIVHGAEQGFSAFKFERRRKV